jgi:hypothetical protein
VGVAGDRSPDRSPAARHRAEGLEPSGFEVRAIDPERSLVMAIDQPKAALSVAITLEPVDHERTRLVQRLRQRAPTWRGWPFLAAMDVGDFLFMGKQLLGVRERAERQHRLEPPPSSEPRRPAAGSDPPRTAAARAGR